MCIFNQPAGLGGYYSSDYPYSQAFLLHTTSSNSNNINNDATIGSRGGVSSVGGGIIWNETTLDRWIENPQQVIPGTTMPNPGISDPMERRAIILTLRSFCIESEEEDGGKITADGEYGVQKHPETEAPSATNVSSSTLTTNNLSLFYSWMTPMIVVSWVLMTSTSGR
jgi:hypothetical protein